MVFFLLLFQSTSPQPGGESGASLKSLKEKPSQDEKDVKEGPVLKTLGANGEITAGT